MCVSMPCGYSSQTLTKYVSYMDLVFGVCTLTIFLILWGFCNGRYPETSQSLFSANAISHYSANYKCLFSQAGPYYLLLFVGLFYCLGSLILALILLHAAQRRNHLTLWKWLVNSCFLYVVRIVIYIVWIITAPPGEKVGPLFLSTMICFYNGMTIHMVQAFIKQIESEGVILYHRKKKRFD